jgi:hypothetical protein
MARPLGAKGEKAVAIRKPAHRNGTVSKEKGQCRVATVTWRFKDSGYAYLPGSNGEIDLRSFV